jgi:CubicO group peptidase (beta-lactamase class C family)
MRQERDAMGLRAALYLTVCVVIGVATAARAQPAPPSEAVTAATRLLSAINGDAAARSAFAADAYSARALEAEPAPARAAFLERLSSDSGGLELVSLKATGARMAEAVVATRNGRFARFVLFTSRDEPGKVSTLFVLPARDPKKADAEAWPAKAIPRDAVAKEIAWRLDRLARDDVFSGVVLVADGDRVLFRRAYGLADQSWQIPSKPDTAFHAGSVTKMLTAAAILKLAEQKRLSLDDTLAAWVPAYPHAAAAARITLRQLLSHTGGLGSWDVQGLRATSTAELVRAMTAPPDAEPGARFAYSNAGFILLGAVIEKATGLEFDRALKSLVLDPVGMPRTAAWPVTAVVPNRATGYQRPAADPLGVGPRYANDQYLGYKGDGSGGLYTTVDDLFAFHRAVIGGKFFGPEATRLFLTAVTDFPGTPRPSKYGLGARFTECSGRPVFGHSGGGANSGVSAATFATLDGRWTVIVLANYDTIGEEVAQAICDTVARG